MDIFPSDIPNADKGFTTTQTENVNENSFGDGYSQRISIGLNQKKRKLELTWSVLNPATGKSLFSWLAERKNLTTFLYTAFGDTERQYICRECSMSDYSPSYIKVTATFEEDFNL